ncbi:MAG: protein kinase [Planctomycetaceae bacterium]
MRVECPNCHVKLNFVDDALAAETSCPSCGSRIPLNADADTTVTYRPKVADRIGPFELLGKVGAGQFGAVWKARDTRLKRIVAIKVPRSETFDDYPRGMFLREAQAAATLEHPGIVRIHEVANHDDQVCIVSEFIVGETLRDRLTGDRLTFPAAAEMIATISEAIHYAHEKGIIHRDLKPGNILLDESGQPHVADFGLAKQIDNEVTMTVSGAILGTPAYMSPEQARGDNRRVDRRSDVFSLGVMLYEMLTGMKPFNGSSQIQLLQQIQSRDPRSPRSVDGRVPRDLETICLKSLSKPSDRRYATAKELAEDLRRFLAGSAILARPETALQQGARWVRRNKALATVGMVALLSTTLAAALTLQKPVEPPPFTPGPPSVSTLMVELDTEPSGASLVFVPRDPLTGEGIAEKAIRPTEKSPAIVELAPGNYFVVAKLDDRRFHEVQRYVPQTANEFVDSYRHTSWTKSPVDPMADRDAKESIRLPRIVIPEADSAAGMIPFGGSDAFQVGVPGDEGAHAQHERKIVPFFLDAHEVTILEYLAKNGGKFPRNLRPQDDPWPQDFPLTHLFYDSAIEYAESIGKRLPSEFEYEFAATNGGTTKFPWGNGAREISPEMSAVGQPDFDRTQTVPPVSGLFSNGAEFTESWGGAYPKFAAAAKALMPAPGVIIAIRGGLIGGGTELPPGLIVNDVGARMRLSLARTSCVHDHLGFRCAKSKTPRW